MTDDLDIEIQIPHQPSNQLQLLVIFSPKIATWGRTILKSFATTVATPEVAGAMGAAQKRAQSVHIHESGNPPIDLSYEG